MAVEWQLQQMLASRGIANAPELKRVLEETLGIRISRAGLDKLLKNTPVQLRLETAQTLCTLLQVPLSAFFIVTPEPLIPHSGKPVQPYSTQNELIDSIITDPTKFL